MGSCSRRTMAHSLCLRRCYARSCRGIYERQWLAKPAGGASTASVPPAGGASAGGDDGGDLNPGDTGPRVTKLQEELAERGFYKGAFDGSFGAETAKAVTAFKQANKLGADPKAGSKVLGLLGIGL